jgi:hypothetical protein
MLMLSIILIVLVFFILLSLVAEFKVIRKAFDNNYNFLKKYVPYILLFHLIQIIIGFFAYGLYNITKGEKAMPMSDQWEWGNSYNNEGIALILVLVIFICGNYLQHRYIWSVKNKVNTFFFTLPSQLLGLLFLLIACVLSN